MKTKKLVMTAMLAALTCAATMIIKIPTPLKGYINPGDSMVLISGWILSPAHGFFAAAFGSALADIFSGYIVYAPATFVIKGVMALIAHSVLKAKRKKGMLASQIIGGVTAELTMIGGYFLFEGFLYGFIPSVANIPANAMQGLAGIILGILLSKILLKSIDN